jgi:mono/diheme cytochrome c family protein
LLRLSRHARLVLDAAAIAAAALVLAPSPALGGGKPGVGADVARGQLIFNKYFCSSCHTLKAAGPEAHGQLGPNFDKTKIPFPLAVAAVTNGMPVASPSFPIKLGFGTLLTRQQIQDVAAFISKYSGARKTCAECAATRQS